MGQPPSLCFRGKEIGLASAQPVTEDCIRRVLAAACGGSLYSAADAINSGYLTLSGGHRIGISGRMARVNGITTLLTPTSLNIRIARDIHGVGTELTESTLIAGPPGCGKTTLLRDCIRILSDKRFQRVSVADERGELSGNGSFYLGARTDVMTGCAKAEAMERMLRTMHPDWLAADEITREEDAELLIRGAYCGARLLASCHVQSAMELRQRPIYKRLADSGVFSQVILMQRDHRWKAQRMEEIA